MPMLLIVGEDAPCCAFGERLARKFLPTWHTPLPAIDTGGVTKLRAALPRYCEQAKFVQHVLCIADTDGQCPVSLLRTWLPSGVPDRFVLRLAVTEAESWALADATEFAAAYQVPASKVPARPDDASDAKSALLALAKRSKSRTIRDEVVSAGSLMRPGTGYNLHLCRFIRQHWRPEEAMTRSPSLLRAVRRLQLLADAQL